MELFTNYDVSCVCTTRGVGDDASGFATADGESRAECARRGPQSAVAGTSSKKAFVIF